MNTKEIREAKAKQQKKETAEADAEAFFKAKKADSEYWRHFANKIFELRSEME